jgi:tetratricopeptide (TPR) repeat protein
VSGQSERYVGATIGHIRLIEPLGEGGMGTVFLGWDDALQRKVAVKAIRQEYRLNAEAKVRFVREARLLSQLAHPNVCTVYDFIEDEDTDFLVLQLVDGVSLRQALDDGLTQEAKLAIAEQLLEVLAVVHERGVIHRDLKPENVMVNPDGSITVLDFGLARLVESAGDGPLLEPTESDVDTQQAAPQCPDEAPPRDLASSEGQTLVLSGSEPSRSTKTTVGEVLGTAGYMSPEQARGEPASAASDLYSAGILFYELFSDSTPYPKDMPEMELILRAATADVQPLEGVDGELARLIEDLTRLDANERPTAESALASIRDIRQRPVRRARRRQLMALGVVAVLAVVAAVLVTRHLTASRMWVDAAEPGRVAVLPFVNSTDSDSFDWVRHGLQEVTSRTLAAAVAAPVVAAGEVAEVSEDLGLDGRSVLTHEEVLQLTTALEAEVLVTAAVLRGGGQYHLESRAYRPNGPVGDLLISGGDLLDAARRLSDRLAPHLASEDRRSTEWGSRQLSRDPFVNLAFAIGVSEMKGQSLLGATKYFEVCVDRDPEFVLGLLHLAECELETGDSDRAEELANRALALARQRDLPDLEAECLLRLGRISSRRGDFDAARSHIAVVLEQATASGVDEQTVVALNAIGRTALRQHRYKEARQWLEQALDRARQSGLRRDQMVVLNNLGMLHWQQAEPEAARDALTKAIEIARTLGDRNVLTTGLLNLGGMALSLGQLDEGEAALREVVELAEETGQRAAVEAAVNNLGALAVLRGELEEAEELLTRALELRREAGDRPGEATTLNNLGQVATNLGKHDEAEAYWRQALQIRRSMDDLSGQGRVLLSQAEAAAVDGETERARRLCTEALELLREAEDASWQASAHLQLGDLAADDGDIAVAAEHLQAALPTRSGDPRALMLEAKVAFARGDPERALTLQQQAKQALGPTWTETAEAELQRYKRVAGGETEASAEDAGVG